MWSLILSTMLGCVKDPLVTGPILPSPVCGAMPDGSRVFKILHINDVYRIEGLLDGRGGLARVAALRTELEATCPELLITHGGDLLSPSLLSKSTNNSDPEHPLEVRFHGAHMIDILSRLDGDPDAFDDRMFVAIGNHEFDSGKADFAPTLDRLFETSGFTWLDTGLTWASDKDGPVIAADNLVSTHTVQVAGVTVGLFGMTIDKSGIGYVTTNPDYAAVARSAIATLDEAGAQVILGITHLDVRDDLALLEAIPEHPHLILGGHNHTAMTRTASDGRLVVKADADATTVRIVTVTVAADGTVTIQTDHPDDTGTPLSPDTQPADPAVQGAVDSWLSALDASFCGLEALGCLAEPLTVAGTTLIAEELEIRRYETNLGNWVADQALGVFAEHEADLAFINSGGMRLNQNITAGTAIPRQVVEELFPYSAGLYLVEVTGAELQGVADRSIADWDGNGHWLQISGWGFRHDPDAATATGLSLLPVGDSAVAIDPAKTYRVVVNDYLLADWSDRDGYTFPVRKVGVAADGTDLKMVVMAALRAAGDTGISPAVEGRICNTRRPGACRLP
ncbi:MAG: 2',3'-cyclic-nucleotide 2'-phosphodiesterase (5'-nucleotidase family) [Myxococcota bacterium]|jgi:2',3'-cyclic-nucleotide 2'-phosphodiesterase (5'-nucleotidase family)